MPRRGHAAERARAASASAFASRAAGQPLGKELAHGLTQQAAVEPAVVDGRDQGVDGQPLQLGSVRRRVPASKAGPSGGAACRVENRASMNGRYETASLGGNATPSIKVLASGEERLAAQGPRRREPACGVGRSVGDHVVQQHRKKVGADDLLDGRIARDDVMPSSRGAVTGGMRAGKKGTPGSPAGIRSEVGVAGHNWHDDVERVLASGTPN